MLARDSQFDNVTSISMGSEARPSSFVEDLAFAVNVQFVRVPGRHERLAVIPEREYELMLSVLRHKQAGTMRDTVSGKIPEQAADAIRRGESPVRALRKARGLKAAELARLVGLTPSMLSQMETTGRSGSVATLYRLSLALNVPMEALISGSESEKLA
ncbi:MAG: helix-turn-helix domain-containing protein [Rhizobiaceae bacterium]|nr:helix-turn-helix domain-containing protein [Rhizobiaceae bacterium]